MYRYEQLKRHCLECGDILVYGRANRKFCCEACKNKWHNRRKSISWERYEQKIIHILERNHQILCHLVETGVTSIEVTDLARLGYEFDYVTSYRREGKRQLFQCFEIRYYQYGNRVYGIEDCL